MWQNNHLHMVTHTQMCSISWKWNKIKCIPPTIHIFTLWLTISVSNCNFKANVSGTVFQSFEQMYICTKKRMASEYVHCNWYHVYDI